MRGGKKSLASVWSQAKASASHPGCKWTPLGWYAVASKAIPDIWWGDVMTAPAVTGTAVHFPLEWAELPSPCGLMACVCVSVSKRKQARILTRCTSNTAYSKIQQYKQSYTSKLGAASKTAASLHIAQLWSKLFYSRFHCDFLWSDRHMLTVDETVVPLFQSERLKRTWRKSAADACTAPWLMLLHLWPGQAFTLSQHSSHHDCVPLEV